MFVPNHQFEIGKSYIYCPFTWHELQKDLKLLLEDAWRKEHLAADVPTDLSEMAVS